MKRGKTKPTWLIKTSCLPSWCRRISWRGTPRMAVEPSFLSRIRRRQKETTNPCVPFKRAPTSPMKRFLLWSLRWSSQARHPNFKCFICNPRLICRSKSKHCKLRTRTPPPCLNMTKRKLLSWQLNWAEILKTSNRTIWISELVIHEATFFMDVENDRQWVLGQPSQTSTMRIAALSVAMNHRTPECKYSTKFFHSQIRPRFFEKNNTRVVTALLIFKLYNI